MNLRKLISICMLMAASTALCDTVFYLKDGSVLTGFIRTQPSIANSDWLIRAERALLCVPKDRVHSIQNEHFIPMDYLDPLWIEWANENKGWEKDDKGKIGLKFCDVSFVGRSPSMIKNMHIVKEGPVYQLMTLDEEDYTIHSADVHKKVMSPTPPDIISGIKSQYVFDRGTGKGLESVQGQLIEVEDVVDPKKGTDKIYTVLTEDGERKTFPKSSLISETISKMNPDQDILEQVEYLDLIEVKGLPKPQEGVIILKDHQFRNITLYVDEENTNKYPLSQIVNFSKRKNTVKYQPKMVLAPGQIQINNTDVAPTYDVQYADPYMVLVPQADREQMIVGSHSKLKIKGNFTQAKNAEDYVLIKINNVSLKDVPEVSKVLTNLGTSRVYLFPYNDLKERPIQPTSIQTTNTGITTLEYKLPQSGLYGLYDKVNKEIILINVL